MISLNFYLHDSGREYRGAIAGTYVAVVHRIHYAAACELIQFEQDASQNYNISDYIMAWFSSLGHGGSIGGFSGEHGASERTQSAMIHRESYRAAVDKTRVSIRLDYIGCTAF